MHLIGIQVGNDFANETRGQKPQLYADHSRSGELEQRVLWVVPRRQGRAAELRPSHEQGVVPGVPSAVLELSPVRPGRGAVDAKVDGERGERGGIHAGHRLVRERLADAFHDGGGVVADPEVLRRPRPLGSRERVLDGVVRSGRDPPEQNTESDDDDDKGRGRQAQKSRFRSRSKIPSSFGRHFLA